MKIREYVFILEQSACCFKHKSINYLDFSRNVPFVICYPSYVWKALSEYAERWNELATKVARVVLGRGPAIRCVATLS